MPMEEPSFARYTRQIYLMQLIDMMMMRIFYSMYEKFNVFNAYDVKDLGLWKAILFFLKITGRDTERILFVQL